MIKSKEYWDAVLREGEDLEYMRHQAYYEGQKSMMGRIPIDQAPRDGTLILGFNEKWPAPRIIQWSLLFNRWMFLEFSNWSNWPFNETRDAYAFSATHFMYIAGE
jgi:hypothetical protein